MGKLIRYIIAAALCVLVYIGIRLPGAVGNIDTTGQPPVWLTVIAAVAAVSLFVWCAFKINKTN
jgi:hypothetical protein